MSRIVRNSTRTSYTIEYIFIYIIKYYLYLENLITFILVNIIRISGIDFAIISK